MRQKQLVALSGNVRQKTLSLASIATLLVGMIAPLSLATKTLALSGNGSTSTPYLIADCDDLIDMSQKVVSDNANYGNKVYQLTDDIDCTGKSFNPISGMGWDTPFMGEFDGAGHTISNIFAGMESGGVVNFGLFGYVEGGHIHDINLKSFNYNIDAEYGNVGEIADTNIVNSFAATIDRSVTSDISGSMVKAGAALGAVNRSSTTTNSYGLTSAMSDPTIGWVETNGTANISAIDATDPSVSYFKNTANQPLQSWDFANIWTRDNNGVIEDGFPYLRAPNSNITPSPSPVPSNDLNGDGIDDSTQANVKSTKSLKQNDIVLELSPACDIDSLAVRSANDNAIVDAGYSYPDGMAHFSANCGTPGISAQIKLYYYGVDPADLVARKFKSANNAYTTLSEATIIKQIINGQTVTVLSYSVVDGGPLDDDGVANGMIVDPVGLGALKVGSPNTGL